MTIRNLNPNPAWEPWNRFAMLQTEDVGDARSEWTVEV